MRRIMYVMEFKGRGEQRGGSENIWVTKSGAPCTRITTEIGEAGVDARVEEIAGPRAEFNSQVAAADGGELGPGKPFREWGTVSFGGDDVLRFDTVGSGQMEPAAEPGFTHGGIVWRVEGGTGCFAGASGVITSNFIVDGTGAVTDYHCGVIFVP